jgi:deoxyribonuclease V
MNLFEYTYNLVRQIPDGKISSYGAVARALGDIRASRAVGRMMNQNPDADTMPCYKIVHSDGKLGGFGLGVDDKIRRLQNDDIMVKDGRIVDFDHVFFDDFNTEYPLKQLREEQINLSKKIRLTDTFASIETVAGIDVAYPLNDFEHACGVCVVMEYQTKQIIEEKTVHLRNLFPYIPTYLAYRELSFIEQLVQNLDAPPSVLLLDGNGILHPYRFGLASHAGVLHDIPSVGVAKNLLYGTVQDNIITIENEPSGYALMPSKQGKKPIYVSPGHNISVEHAKDVVQNLCKYKLPEPLRQAHIRATTYLRG